MARKDWYVVSSHGAVLFFIAWNPGCTVDEIVRGMHLTPRTVWGLIGDLRRAGMLTVHREGRHHRYTVDLDGPFPLRTLTGVQLRTILGGIAQDGEQTTASVSSRG